ncbi:hypothetical protein FBQ85_05345 [Cytophagia bacterium CHB2]|nr:hypothetical protein [Cytophagia bacterium CHB2]
MQRRSTIQRDFHFSGRELQTAKFLPLINDGSLRDITFLPRTSHETITYGSSGLFMTAGDLVFWCQSLFTGKVLKQSSLAQMLSFNQQGYGLGMAGAILEPPLAWHICLTSKPPSWS